MPIPGQTVTMMTTDKPVACLCCRATCFDVDGMCGTCWTEFAMDCGYHIEWTPEVLVKLDGWLERRACTST